MRVSMKFIALATDFCKSFYRAIAEDMYVDNCINVAAGRDLVGFERFWIDKDGDVISIKSIQDWIGCIEMARRREMKVYIVHPTLMQQFSPKSIINMYKQNKSAFLVDQQKDVEVDAESEQQPIQNISKPRSNAVKYYSSTINVPYVDINSSVSEASFYSTEATSFIEAGSALVQLASNVSDTMKNLSDLTKKVERKTEQKLLSRPRNRSVPVNYSDADLKAILHTQTKQLNTAVTNYLSPKPKANHKCYSNFEEMQDKFAGKWFKNKGPVSPGNNSIKLARSTSLSSTEF